MDEETSPTIRYKFFCDFYGDGRIFSLQTAYRWTVGPWHHVEGPYDNVPAELRGDSVFFDWHRAHGASALYTHGFDCSGRLLHAFLSTPGTIVACVEVKDLLAIKGDLEVWRSMRIVQAWYWNKVDSVHLAIVAAEFALPLFEASYPVDHRPRGAIEAARHYLATPSSESIKAARHAADLASYAAYPEVYHASYAASYAAFTASAPVASYTDFASCAAPTAATSEAAKAIYFAARAAEIMAPSGRREALYKHISSWMEGHLAELVPYAGTERS
jgi:hypothetical protein